MINSLVDNKVLMPNMLLIAGNGRNVGKTYLACKIIQHFSQSHNVTGIKISPHMHETDDENCLIRNNNFSITKEQKINSKDSSLMLQSGAAEVFFVTTKREYLKDAFYELQKILPEGMMICESGGLHEWVTPGLFFFVKKQGEEIVKRDLLSSCPIIVNNNGRDLDFSIEDIRFEQNQFIFQKA
ncbi:MAG: hypothetical protein R2757_17580 [Draconibacterium sp.]